MLHQVFCLLPPRDLKNVVLVCRLWREVGDWPGFWAWVWAYALWPGQLAGLRVTRENMSSMPERLGSRRMRAVRVLWVERGAEVTEEVVLAVARHPGMRAVKLRVVINMAACWPVSCTGWRSWAWRRRR